MALILDGMTYTGRPRITVAADLPAAVHPSIDIWLRTPSGGEGTVSLATRVSDTITVAVNHCNWPQADTREILTFAADDPIVTRVY